MLNDYLMKNDGEKTTKGSSREYIFFFHKMEYIYRFLNILFENYNKK